MSWLLLNAIVVDGFPPKMVLVNTDQVNEIEPHKDGAVIYYADGGRRVVTETQEQIGRVLNALMFP